MADGEFRFRNVDNIGSAAAEDDSMLVECFVDVGYLEVLQDVNDARSIVLGRTGVGKSGLLRCLAERRPKNVVRLRPENLALEHISASELLNRLDQMGVRLDLFFRLLWRHVICVEVIRKRAGKGASTEKGILSFLERLFKPSARAAHREALEYVQEWGDEFWKDTDFRIKELTQKFEQNVMANAGVSLAAINGEVGASTHRSSEATLEVRDLAQNAVNNVQIRKLNNVIDLVDEVLDDPQNPTYVLIDQLDDDWVHEPLRYRMVRALVEAVKDFSRARNLKIIVALREDLIQTVFARTRGPGFQAEKYRSICLELDWHTDDLLQVLDKRISTLVKRRYTKKPVSLEDVLPGPRGRPKQSAKQFIVERTLGRPRDGIDFVNRVIQLRAGKKEISWTALDEALPAYSESRRSALCDEWVQDYPNLEAWMRIVSNWTGPTSVGDLNSDTITALALATATDPDGEPAHQPLLKAATEFVNDEIDEATLKAKVAHALHRIGVLGIRNQADGDYRWAKSTRAAVSETVVSATTKLRVHPMYATGLGSR